MTNPYSPPQTPLNPDTGSRSLPVAPMFGMFVGAILLGGVLFCIDSILDLHRRFPDPPAFAEIIMYVCAGFAAMFGGPTFLYSLIVFRRRRAASRALGGRDNRIKQSAADKSYRHSAFPFGLFLLVGGITFCVVALATPAHAISLPPFEAEMTTRAVCFTIGLSVFVMGVGFLRRRVWALYAFVGYVLLGTVWHVVAGLAAPASRGLLVSPLFNLPIGFGIYWATHAAFIPAAQHGTVAEPSVRQEPH